MPSHSNTPNYLPSCPTDSQKNAAASISSVYIDGAETAWAASENYVVPWESTRRRELGAMGGRRLTTVPSNCGLFSSTFMTGKDLEEQQAAMDAEVAATAATTTTTASPGAPINYDPPADTTTSVMESSSSKDTGGYVMTKLLSPFQSLANLMMSVEDNADAPEPEGTRYQHTFYVYTFSHILSAYLSILSDYEPFHAPPSLSRSFSTLPL